MAAPPVIIVGAGQAGLQAAESLRSGGFDGGIVLLGSEPHLPYHRPPLSKGLLLGQMTAEQVSIRQSAALDKKRLDVRLGVTVAGIDPAARQVVLADGGRLGYQALILATGARPRTLPVPGGDARGVHCLRTLDDALAIGAVLGPDSRVVVVGGGFIGLEMAAVARGLGAAVTVIEAADRLMARVVAPPVSAYFHALHTRHGCALHLNSSVAALETVEGAVSGVRCGDGTVHPADLVVLGIGVVPETGLAEAAGLAPAGGILVDACGRTAYSDIYAIGDCAAQRSPDGSIRRLESVQNAVESAKACAAAILGREAPFVAAPWFWSDQYDAKLQMVGLSAGFDSVVTRGDASAGAVAWFYFRDGRLIAVDSVNRPADHMAGRKLLAGPNTLTPAQSADEGFALKSALEPVA